MDTTQILLAALTGVMTFAFGVVLAYLYSLSKKIDRAEDRADKRAAEDRAAADKRAAEDRAANKADHDKLFQLVAGLQSDVKVLRDRSDRSDRSDLAD